MKLIGCLLIAVVAMGFAASSARAQVPSIQVPGPLLGPPPKSNQPTGGVRPALNNRRGHVENDAPSDIKCSVLEWNITLPKPILSLVCPPEEVFAPLRVYFKLSWQKPEDMPDNYLKIVAVRRMQAKMHWTKTELHVLLMMKHEEGRKQETKWVSFDEVVGFYLQSNEH